MKKWDIEFYELIKMFEKEYFYLRLAKEDKDANIPETQVYQNGSTNELFRAYMQGYSYGKLHQRLNEK